MQFISPKHHDFSTPPPTTPGSVLQSSVDCSNDPSTLCISCLVAYQCVIKKSFINLVDGLVDNNPQNVASCSISQYHHGSY